MAPTTSVEPALKPEYARASNTDQDEEERRRASRSGGDINPANASHSLNMRPDVTQGPAGLEVRTSIKSADYRARPSLEADLAKTAREARADHPELFPERTAGRDAAAHRDAPGQPGDELADHPTPAAPAKGEDHGRENRHQPANTSLEDDLAEVAREARAEHPELFPGQSEDRDTPVHRDAPPHPGEEPDQHQMHAASANKGDLEREQAYQLARAESTKRQDVERLARSGEAMPSEVASSATNSLADDLRAVQQAAQRERESDGRDSDVGERSNTNRSAGRDRGPSIF